MIEAIIANARQLDKRVLFDHPELVRMREAVLAKMQDAYPHVNVRTALGAPVRPVSGQNGRTADSLPPSTAPHVPYWKWTGYIAGNIQFVIERVGWRTIKTIAVLVHRSDNGVELRWSETDSLPSLVNEPDVRAFCYLKDCRAFDTLMAMLAINPSEKNEDILRMPVDLLAREAAERLENLVNCDK